MLTDADAHLSYRRRLEKVLRQKIWRWPRNENCVGGVRNTLLVPKVALDKR